jgi:selenocysteine-specific elongation factor
MIVGTSGHIDHGKTSLIKALTGVDSGHLKEAKARDLSIDLGFTCLPVAGAETISFVDVPGHEKLVDTMLASASGIDFALLVVAADDGIMPQTIEHLMILHLLGIASGAVVLSKADLVSEERLDGLAAEVRETLATTILAKAPILALSVRDGRGLPALHALLAETARSFERRPATGRFRLTIDRFFTLVGAGTIITGTVLSGSVSLATQVVVSPPGHLALVRSIHTQDRAAEKGFAGDRCAINLTGDGITKDAIARGHVVVDPSLHAPADRIDASLVVLPSEPKPISQWFPVRLHHAAAEVGARLVLLSDEAGEPGAEGFVQLVLERPIAATAGDRFVVRDTSARRTIGGGTFLDLRAPARKRRSPDRLRQLEAHALREPEQALNALLAMPPGTIDIVAFIRDRALADCEAETCAKRIGAILLPMPETIFAISASRLAQLCSDLVERLASFHTANPDLVGIGLEKLRLELEPQLPMAAFKSLCRHFAQSGEMGLVGAFVRLASHAAPMCAADERLWQAIEPLLCGPGRFRPPRVRDIAHLLDIVEPEVRRLLKLTSRIGFTYEIAHDHFFAHATIDEMVEIAREAAAATKDGWFTAAQFRDRLQNGRKVTIQILDFFDRHGVTLRRDDGRRINPRYADLFRDTDSIRKP